MVARCRSRCVSPDQLKSRIVTGGEPDRRLVGIASRFAGDVFVDQFRPEAVDDAARIALSRKVEVVHDPAITALGAGFRHKVRLEVHFRDGTVATETREAPRGSEQSFASEAEIVGKFRKLTRAVMGERQRDALIDAVLGLEKLEDAGQLARLMRVG